MRRCFVFWVFDSFFVLHFPCIPVTSFLSVFQFFFFLYFFSRVSFYLTVHVSFCVVLFLSVQRVPPRVRRCLRPQWPAPRLYRHRQCRRRLLNQWLLLLPQTNHQRQRARFHQDHRLQCRRPTVDNSNSSNRLQHNRLTLWYMLFPLNSPLVFSRAHAYRDSHYPSFLNPPPLWFLFPFFFLCCFPFYFTLMWMGD